MVTAVVLLAAIERAIARMMFQENLSAGWASARVARLTSRARQISAWRLEASSTTEWV
jgi:hypothetical protein